MKVSLDQALKRLPAAATAKYPQGAPFVKMMAGCTMSVEVFAPSSSGLGEDLQQPHTQDELYFIQRGTAELVINGQRFDAAAGDAFFVAARVVHRFENFSADFVTWVVFYGEHYSKTS
jgi:mannose-6-phosphate isomerase-like protein (cupin superfamily)